MTIDEAIKHAEEVAEENRNVNEEELGLIYCDDTECIENHKKRCFKCADEHEQLAEWLRDYKRLLEQQPCEDCVSRKEVYETFGELLGTWGTQALMEMSSVTPTRKKGKWLEEWDKEHFIILAYKCSECGIFMNKNTAHYCINCGAEMESEE